MDDRPRVPFSLPLLLDGATGTALLEAGMPQGAAPGLWCLEHPQVLLELQRDYAAAGSRVLLAPTFGMDRLNLQRHGVDPAQLPELERRLLALSREAAGDSGALVAADLSPLGLFLPPAGDTDFEELVELYKEQVAALGDADLFLVETVMTLAEARAAVLAVKELTDKPVFVTFTCDESGRTLSGTDVLAGLIVMEGMGADAFGLNCSTGPQAMLPQLRRLGEYAHIPLIAKPNAGLPQVSGGVTRYDAAPADFAALVPQMARAGVRIFGGCCGTTAGHIAALREAVEAVDFAALGSPLVPDENIPCASEREARFLTPEVDTGPALECGPELLEDILDAEEAPTGAVKISILEEDDLLAFAEAQYAVRDALCIHTDVPQLLEKALRLYQGRAFYDGTGDLPRDFLEAMRRKYGLVLL